MKKRKFLKVNSEKTELLKKISWLKGDIESKRNHIKRLFEERNDTRRATNVDATNFEIYMICNSYESGFGHGLSNDGLDLTKTPHSEQHLGMAYQIGYEAGQSRYKDAKKEDITEDSISNGDAGLMYSTALELRQCANSWDPEAKLLGNVKAGDIATMLKDYLRLRLQAGI